MLRGHGNGNISLHMPSGKFVRYWKSVDRSFNTCGGRAEEGRKAIMECGKGKGTDRSETISTLVCGEITRLSYLSKSMGEWV
jgi:hypothetical protein